MLTLRISDWREHERQPVNTIPHPDTYKRWRDEAVEQAVELNKQINALRRKICTARRESLKWEMRRREALKEKP